MYVLFSFRVPAYVEITDSLAEKLHRLVQLDGRIRRLRDRAYVVYQNCCIYDSLGRDILQIPGEYDLYVDEMFRFADLKSTMWALQADVDELQSQILSEIYGSGVNAD